MKFLIHNKAFKLVCILVSALLTVSIIFGIIGKIMSPQSSIVSAITVPIKGAFTYVSKSISDLFTAYNRIELLQKENAELREKINEQNSQLIEYDSYKNENAFLKEFLDIKEKHSDFSFITGLVSSYDSMSNYGDFTINIGSANGVAIHDPVITSEGVIGYIGELGITSSKVYTILNPSVCAGANDSRTGDTGVVQGDITKASEGLCIMSYLSKNSSVAIGDYIVTTGTGGIFPGGLYIGNVSSVNFDSTEIDYYATIKPIVDIYHISEVMVITDFEGQGNILE